jgi:hypothetical protein
MLLDWTYSTRRWRVLNQEDSVSPDTLPCGVSTCAIRKRCDRDTRAMFPPREGILRRYAPPISRQVAIPYFETEGRVLVVYPRPGALAHPPSRKFFTSDQDLQLQPMNMAVVTRRSSAPILQRAKLEIYLACSYIIGMRTAADAELDWRDQQACR